MSTSVVRRVGIVGLGKMGQPMARHLRRADFAVTAYDIDDAVRRQAKRSRLALASFASSIFHLGDLGAGQVGKMVNNLILWSCISANHEGFKLAERLGVDQERLRTALLESSAANWALETRSETMPMPWAEKEMRIVQSEADRLRLCVPLCGVVAEVAKRVQIERGWPTPAQRET